MNAERLKGIVDLILQLESTHQTQNTLETALANLNNIVGNPNSPNFQTEFVSNLDKAKAANRSILSTLTPGQQALVEAIGAKEYILDDFPTEISQLMQNNPLTPAVIQARFTKFLADRAAYIQRLSQLKDSLNSIGITASSLKEGEGELAVLLPGTIFANEFDDLLKRLRDLNRIIRAFSEAATGGVEPIYVKQISTTDPQFFFGISVVTLALIGRSVAWALETWKRVEEIRNLRQQTQKLSTPLLDIEGIFDKKIKETIEAAIASKTDEMLAHIDGGAGRAKEQKTMFHGHWSLCWRT
jgi:hypothetical protein